MTDPSLGVVLLDCSHYASAFGRFTPSDTRGIGYVPGFFESPSTWPVPTTFAVASGAGPLPTIRGEPQAIEGLARAVDRVAGECDMVITDCGFFYAAVGRLSGRLGGTVLLSGLQLVELAGIMTTDPIGILTISAGRVEEMLAAHRLADRLRIVGVGDRPAWSSLGAEDFATNGRWTHDALRRELLEVVEPAFRAGTWRDVGVLVLECTVLPQFRAVLRSATPVPILDVASIATGALA